MKANVGEAQSNGRDKFVAACGGFKCLGLLWILYDDDNAKRIWHLHLVSFGHQAGVAYNLLDHHFWAHFEELFFLSRGLVNSINKWKF